MTPAMSTTDVTTDLTDPELISLVRGGDVAAYGTLFARHVDAANRLAGLLVSGPDADDLVSEAFVKVLNVLLGGGGPDVAFRAYLLTAVRRLHVDKVRSIQLHAPTGDPPPPGWRAARPRRRSPPCPSAGSWCCGTSRWRTRSQQTSPPC